MTPEERKPYTLEQAEAIRRDVERAELAALKVSSAKWMVAAEQAKARAEKAESEAASLRERVAALIGGPVDPTRCQYCTAGIPLDGDGRNRGVEKMGRYHVLERDWQTGAATKWHACLTPMEEGRAAKLERENESLRHSWAASTEASKKVVAYEEAARRKAEAARDAATAKVEELRKVLALAVVAWGEGAGTTMKAEAYERIQASLSTPATTEVEADRA